MDSEKWKHLVAAESAFYDAKKDYVANALSSSDIRAALSNPEQRGTALRLLSSLSPTYSEQFLVELTRLASTGHSYVGLVRDVIARFYRPSHDLVISATADSLLDRDDSDEEHRRFAELFQQLRSKELMRRHLERCRRHQSPEVSEVADDFADD